MSAPVRRLGKVELLTRPGRPSPARLAVCTLLAAAVGTVGLTVTFLIGAATKGAPALGIAGIAPLNGSFHYVFYGTVLTPQSWLPQRAQWLEVHAAAPVNGATTHCATAHCSIAGTARAARLCVSASSSTNWSRS
jgi:hypothetical protein